VEVKGEVGREPGMGRVALTRGRRPVAPRLGVSGSVSVNGEPVGCGYWEGEPERLRICGRRAGVLVFLMRE